MAISLHAANKAIKRTGCVPAENVEALGILALRCVTIFSALLVTLILVFLVYFSLPLFYSDHWRLLLGWQWDPPTGNFGILPMLIGSLAVATLALALAFPVALAVCCFSVAVGPPLLRPIVRQLVYLMTGIPTIVYALVSATLLVPRLRMFTAGTGYSCLAAAITLSILILPTVVLTMHSYLDGVWERTAVTGGALGMTHAQIFLSVVLPECPRGLAASALLGWGRALGDTMIALMVSGNAPHTPQGVFDTLRTLTAHIALVVLGDTGGPAYHAVFLCGLMLFVIIVIVSTTAQGLRRKVRQRGLR